MPKKIWHNAKQNSKKSILNA